MLAKDKNIEWVQTSWNPLIGCTPFSAGCQNCYARVIAEKFKRNKVKDYEEGFKLHLLPSRLAMPFSWKKPKNIFVNSMSDLFHEEVPIDFIKDVFKVMNKCDIHTFMVLTKRSNRLKQIAPYLNWTQNILMGVTIESNDYRYRLDDLKSTPAVNKFICIEPFIGAIDKLNLTGLSWVIAGGESGPYARPMFDDWVRSLRDWCQEADVPFWFKQKSAYGERRAKATIDGHYYKEEPRLYKSPDLFDFL